MKPALFIRKKNTIKNVITGEVEHFEFINKAKRYLRKLQLSNDGALSLGSVQVKG